MQIHHNGLSIRRPTTISIIISITSYPSGTPEPAAREPRLTRGDIVSGPFKCYLIIRNVKRKRRCLQRRSPNLFYFFHGTPHSRRFLASQAKTVLSRPTVVESADRTERRIKDSRKRLNKRPLSYRVIIIKNIAYNSVNSMNNTFHFVISIYTTGLGGPVRKAWPVIASGTFQTFEFIIIIIIATERNRPKHFKHNRRYFDWVESIIRGSGPNRNRSIISQTHESIAITNRRRVDVD